MFIFVNKDKIISYVVSVSTVMILFVMAYVMTETDNEIIETSSNLIQFNQIENCESSNNTIENEYNKTGLN